MTPGRCQPGATSSGHSGPTSHFDINVQVLGPTRLQVSRGCAGGVARARAQGRRVACAHASHGVQSFGYIRVVAQGLGFAQCLACVRASGWASTWAFSTLLQRPRPAHATRHLPMSGGPGCLGADCGSRPLACSCAQLGATTLRNRLKPGEALLSLSLESSGRPSGHAARCRAARIRWYAAMARRAPATSMHAVWAACVKHATVSTSELASYTDTAIERQADRPMLYITSVHPKTHGSVRTSCIGCVRGVALHRTSMMVTSHSGPDLRSARFGPKKGAQGSNVGDIPRFPAPLFVSSTISQVPTRSARFGPEKGRARPGFRRCSFLLAPIFGCRSDLASPDPVGRIGSGPARSFPQQKSGPEK